MGIIHRFRAGHPVLSAKDLPYPSSLVFNAGICKFHGRYIMLFRNDVGFSPNGWRENDTYTNIGIAESDDGLHWVARPRPWEAAARIVAENPDFIRIYDPRITIIDNRCYLCFAVDTRHGVRGGIAVTDDFEKLELLTLTVPDNRNMVMFPDKINGKFIRLERPFPEYSRGYQERFDIWLSQSPDCRYWGDSQLLLGVEDVPFCNSKLGPAAPPLKTPAGYLTIFHATDKDANRVNHGWEKVNNPAKIWRKRYMAGIMLLDLNDPGKIIGLAKEPLMVAETPYELDGFRGNTIFPGALILEDSGEVKIYYGAADTVECLATADVDDLIAACEKY